MRELAIQPAWIDVEITENTAMRTEASMEEMLTGLAALGVSISIDYFGTGYSSLSYIKRFDIDCLKIAKPLVDNIAQDDGDAKIVGAIILMAKTMGLRTIAEGVEDEDQLAILQELGCDEIQGFLLGKPVPADRFEMLWLDAASE
jgi:EAL domain-containing protein (putative c-di-GMP-specific phosphodiesterase class I)